VPFSVYRQLSESDQAAYRDMHTTSNLKLDLGGKQRQAGDQLAYDSMMSYGESLQGDVPLGASMSSGASRLKDLSLTTPQGAYTPMLSEVARWMGGDNFTALFGWEPGDLAKTQLFTAEAGNAVMARIQETKGAVSDAEMAYFKTISPQLGKEPAANYVMAELLHRAGVRMQNRAGAYAHYVDMKQKAGGVATVAGFNRWFHNADAAKPWNPWAGESDSVDNLLGQYADTLAEKQGLRRVK
jgi:hypothetical protein